MLKNTLAIASTCFVSSVAVAHDQSPALPDTTVDLRSSEALALLSGQWRYTDAHIVEAEFRLAGPDHKPNGAATRTHDVHPRPNTAEFAAAPWESVSPESLESRRSTGKLCFGWYRLDLTVPDRIGPVDAAGATLVVEITIDDYAEVWVDGALPEVLGGAPQLAHGWNTPSRVTISRDAKPGQQIHIAIFAANGPLSNPPSNYVWIRSAALDVYQRGSPGAWVNAPTPVKTDVTRLDAALDRIIEPGTQAERLATGFSFTEGPVWVPAVTDGRYGGGGYLLFSDPNKNIIHRYEPTDGAVTIYRVKSGYSGLGGGAIGEYHQPGSNGLTLDPQGRLTICEHGNRRVTRLEPNGTITVLANRFQEKRLNSPNDLVFRSDGALYFTDPPYGLPKVYDDPRKELPFSGVYCLRNGELKLVVSDLKGPNGIAFSPDEKHLYVDNWDEKNKVIMRYEVAADGSLSGGEVFVDLTRSDPGEICFDGLKVDKAGNVYASAPGGVRIYSPAGRLLGTIVLPELPANFAFGDADGRTLYMCARTSVYRMRTLIAGK